MKTTRLPKNCIKCKRIFYPTGMERTCMECKIKEMEIARINRLTEKVKRNFNSPRLGRFCKYCGERFVPSTKFHRVCNPCQTKAFREKVVKDKKYWYERRNRLR